MLVNNNKNVTLYNALYQKPLDEEVIANELMNYDQIIIYDAYAIENGFPRALTESLVAKGYKGNIVE